MPKQLFIFIDLGFDSMKVIANGKYFKFPFSAIETDERKMLIAKAASSVTRNAADS